MHPQEDAQPETRPSEVPKPEDSQSEDIQSAPASGRDPFGSVVLFAAGALFWGPFLLAVLGLAIASFGGRSMAAVSGFYLAIAMLDFIMHAAFFGGCLLVIYVFIQKPWKNGPASVLFVLQLITLVGFIVLGGSADRSIFEPVKKIVRYVDKAWYDWRDPSPQFRQAMGASRGKGDSPHPSDVEAARKMVASSAMLRQMLREDGGLLCGVAGLTDVQGLEFLVKEVLPDAKGVCSLAQAAEMGLTYQNYAAAAWLVDRVSEEELPGLAKMLQGSLHSFDPVNLKAGEIDDESRAMPVLERMIKRGLSPNARPGGTSLLKQAVIGKRAKIAALLLTHGADPNEHESGYAPIIHDAVGAGPELVRAFLATPGLRLDVADHKGNSLMASALFSNNTETVAILMDAGLRFKASFAEVRAIRDPKIMQMLIERGFDPRWRDEDGNTLLAYFYRSESFPEMAAMLVKAGLPLNARNRYGATILNYLTTDESEADARSTLIEAEARSALIDLGAQLGKPDQRQQIVYRRQPAVKAEYMIRLHTGKEITGRTDVFGKTSWVPDATPFEVEWVRPSL